MLLAPAAGKLWPGARRGSTTRGPAAAGALRPPTIPTASLERTPDLVTELLGRLNGTSPEVKRALWRAWYELLASRYRQPEWTFMNYGYAPLASEAVEALEERDEKDRYPLALYRHLIGEVDLQGAAVLEVGSGRGGGCSYVARYRQPTSLVGIDFSRQAVAFCHRTHRIAGLSFRQGDAEALPCGDGEFDAVLNVESSHCYRSMPAFAGQVMRVLKPGGLFLWADLGPPDWLTQARRHFREAGLVTAREARITPNVLQALDLMHDERAEMIRRLVPRPVAGPFGDFAGLRGTRVYTALRAGTVEYISCVLRKPGETGVSSPD